MKLLFEKSQLGRGGSYLPHNDTPCYTLDTSLLRGEAPRLPELAETDIARHYTALAGRAFGVNDGFYPLGSCTMKYNAALNEAIVALPGFIGIHPLQPQETVQGCLEVLYLMTGYLCELTGMDALSLQPAAGSQGEFGGLMLIKAYHQDRGDFARTKIIVPDSAHGTNPASVSMVGYEVVNIASNAEGLVDLDSLRAAVGSDTAGLMLTNPNTVGLFEREIETIADIVHAAGGLLYYDGANLNAIMGKARPGDMGFDVVHLNLHKTFGTPHGGGGPGAGPLGCKALLASYLPRPLVKKSDGIYSFDEDIPQSIGRLLNFYGNFLVVVKAFAYICTLGKEGLLAVAEDAVLNANYLMKLLSEKYKIAFESTVCMHEFVLTLADMKKEYHVAAMDIAKTLIDQGIHPPTMYFPLIVPEALMVEPTETESKETLEQAAAVFLSAFELARENPEALHESPVKTPVRRLDDVAAARNPRLRFKF